MAGAAGSYFTTRLTERDRVERELRVRWDAHRLDSYVAYVAAVKHVYRCAQQVFTPQWDDGDPAARDPLLVEMRSAEGDRSHAFEQVMLLGDTATVQAAHELNNRLWQLERPARGAEEITQDMWQERANEWLVALNNFHEHARQNLGIAGESARREWCRRLARTRSSDSPVYVTAWAGGVLMTWSSQCPGAGVVLVSRASKVPWGRPLLGQCRASVGRVKGGLGPSPAAISLRFTLDSAHSGTGEKRVGGWAGGTQGVRAVTAGRFGRLPALPDRMAAARCSACGSGAAREDRSPRSPAAP